MWKFFNPKLILTGLIAVVFSFCQNQPKQKYTRISPGFYYRLISFHPENNPRKKEPYTQLGLSFRTQSDSVFWDSYNNFNDLYIISTEEINSPEILNSLSCKAELNDSFELLLPTVYFYKTYFHQENIPLFSQADSVVKVQVKIKEYLSQHDYQVLVNNLQNQELQLIRNYFKTEELFQKAKDSMGVYWVQNPNPWSPPPQYKDFDRLMVNYQGYFLSGRLFEKSHTDFELIYGIPDQMVKGLNYVMACLNEGQTAKIILPSALAFGEKGSSNGTVPPFTPVLYNIKLTEVKRK